MSSTKWKSDLPDRLHELHASKRQVGLGIHGQMCGMESYRLVASGNTFHWLIEAADYIKSLEAVVNSQSQSKGDE